MPEESTGSESKFRALRIFSLTKLPTKAYDVANGSEQKIAGLAGRRMQSVRKHNIVRRHNKPR